MGKLLRRGSRGDDVRELQTQLTTLGFKLDSDGIFGGGTETVVKKLQTAFGYTVDGIVGDGTKGLIEAQVGYGWDASAPDAQERALRSQGKTAEADALKKQAGAGGKDGGGKAPPAKAPPAKAPPKGGASKGGKV